MAGYNTTRFDEDLLERTASLPPSLTIHLHTDYWLLNSGNKFLYNNPVASLLDDVSARRIPTDFLDLFDSAGVQFYDGCMIVSLLDYRPLPKVPQQRVVLHPNSETMWADICALNKKVGGGQWTDMQALEIESQILLATTPPLCLDPIPHLARVANHVIRVSTPSIPASLKRKAASSLDEEDKGETDKARRAKIMAYMNPRQNRVHAPNLRLQEEMERSRQQRQTSKSAPQTPVSQTASTPQPNPQQQAQASTSSQQKPLAPVPARSQTPSMSVYSASSPAQSNGEPPKKKVKKNPSRAESSASPYSRASTQTPVQPPQPALPNTQQPQQYPYHPNNNNNGNTNGIHSSPTLQPNVYASVQASIDSNRAGTPNGQRPANGQPPGPPRPGQNAQTFQPPNAQFQLQPPPTRNPPQRNNPPANQAPPNPSPAQQAYILQQQQAQMQYFAAAIAANTAGTATSQQKQHLQIFYTQNHNSHLQQQAQAQAQAQKAGSPSNNGNARVNGNAVNGQQQQRRPSPMPPQPTAGPSRSPMPGPQSQLSFQAPYPAAAARPTPPPTNVNAARPGPPPSQLQPQQQQAARAAGLSAQQIAYQQSLLYAQANGNPAANNAGFAAAINSRYPQQQAGYPVGWNGANLAAGRMPPGGAQQLRLQLQPQGQPQPGPPQPQRIPVQQQQVQGKVPR